MDGISQKVLTTSLRELEADGIIFRKDYCTNPPKVEYGLTEIGKEKGKLVREEFNWLDEILQKGITKDELETVYRILEKIEKNLTDL